MPAMPESATDPAGSAERVYQRDASWHNTIGRGGKYHWPTEFDVARAACSRNIMLHDGLWQDADATPAWQRCMASGCRQRWATDA